MDGYNVLTVFIEYHHSFQKATFEFLPVLKHMLFQNILAILPISFQNAEAFVLFLSFPDHDPLRGPYFSFSICCCEPLGFDPPPFSQKCLVHNSEVEYS